MNPRTPSSVRLVCFLHTVLLPVIICAWIYLAYQLVLLKNDYRHLDGLLSTLRAGLGKSLGISFLQILAFGYLFAVLYELYGFALHGLRAMSRTGLLVFLLLQCLLFMSALPEEGDIRLAIVAFAFLSALLVLQHSGDMRDRGPTPKDIADARNARAERVKSNIKSMLGR